jgi:hypothetical protein
MISIREAEWIDAHKKAVRVFYQKYDDVLDHFVKSCLPREGESTGAQQAQLPLPFPEE